MIPRLARPFLALFAAACATPVATPAQVGPVAPARAVRDFLVSKGVPASRLGAPGFGETHLIAPTDTPENLRKNRRTELTVVGEVAE